jgi:gliding motility-associated-like protein
MKNLIRFIGLLAGALMFSQNSYGQYCPNLKFDMANFTNWDCYAGSCGSGIVINPSPPMGGRHTIINMAQEREAGTEYDEQCVTILKAPEEFPYSCRIGNSATGAEMEAIEYTMTVDSNNSLLVLHFAWVMENPPHPPSQQPQFTMTVKDGLGNPLNIPCSYINFVASSDLVGLACTGSVLARNWTTAGYSLLPFMGQKIKIYFETRDCAQGGHYGYAYIVGECRAMELELQFCAGDPPRLKAPEGFSHYKWTRSGNPTWVYEGSGRVYQYYTCTDPGYEEVITCELTSELGAACSVTLQTVLIKTSIDADFKYGIMNASGEVEFDERAGGLPLNWYDTCTRTVTFVDLSTIVNGTKKNITWEIKGLNVVSHDSLFTYTFPDVDVPTDYTVCLKVETERCVGSSSESPEYHIMIYPSPKIRIEGTTQLCAGNADTLRAVAVRSTYINHEWSWRDTSGTLHTSSGDSFLVIQGPGNYILASQDRNGCIARDTHTVTSLRPQLASFEPTPVKCFGESTGAFRHGAITGGQLPYQTAYWQFPGEATTRPCNVSGGQFLNLKAGTYIFVAIDMVGCLISGEIVITEPSLLELSGAQEATTCGNENGKLKLTALEGTPPYRYEIKKENGQVVALSDTVSNLSSERYKIKVTDANDCVAEDTISVTASPLPSMEVVNKIWETCESSNGSIQIRPVKARNPVRFTWMPGSAGDTSNSIGKLKAGEYYVKMTDANACVVDTTIIIESYPIPTVSIVKTPETCNRVDGSIRLSVISLYPHTIKYVWEGRSDTGAILTGLKAGTYKVHIADTLCSLERTIEIEHTQGPEAGFEANTYNVACNRVFALTDMSKGMVNKWDWDMGDSKSQTGNIVYHTYTKSGDYRVWLIVTDTNACKDTISKIIHVYEELNVFIPNIFTPNEDNINNEWGPVMSEYLEEGYELAIFDRWGNRMFYTTNTNEKWDGMIKGKAAASNTTYSYRILVRDCTGQEHEFIGQITLVR